MASIWFCTDISMFPHYREYLVLPRLKGLTPQNSNETYMFLLLAARDLVG